MAKKQYAPADDYERKLGRIMDRMGVKDFNYNWDRHGCYIEFHYKNELYRFDHSIQKAIDLKYGSDAFAQVVLSLEDLARMVERGIYDLSTWVAGMKYLPPSIQVPSFFRLLGFTEIPTSPEEVHHAYREKAKVFHSDAGGKDEDFKALVSARDQAIKFFGQ